MVKRWKFDSKLLTNEEMAIISESNRKINAIYERIHYQIIANNKLKKKQYIKTQKDLKYKEELKKQAEKEQKIKIFLEKIEEFKKEYYTAMFDKQDIELIHRKYKDICIHPEIFKAEREEVFKIDEEICGGQSSRTYFKTLPSYLCNFCHECKAIELSYTDCKINLGETFIKHLNEKPWKVMTKPLYY